MMTRCIVNLKICLLNFVTLFSILISLSHARPNPEFPVRAVNLGGWLVAEGSVKPSLFDAIPNNDLLDGTSLRFKSVTAGKYLTAKSGGGNVLLADSTGASDWETFTLWRINENSFRFRVFNKQFVGLDGINAVAVSNTPVHSETFQIVRKNYHNSSRVRIKAPNGYFLQAKTEELVIANVSNANGWENDDPTIFEMTIVATIQGEFQVTNGYGPTKAPQIMKEHWNTFIVENDFKFMASHGLHAARIPVGWWIASDPNPPAPYVGGSLHALDNAFKWAEKYGLKIIIDLHAAPGSQNGFDSSSSRDGSLEWGKTYENIKETVDVIDFLTARYAKRPSLFAVELLNEPTFQGVTLESLTKYYKDGYEAVRKHSSTAYVVFSNRLEFSNQIEIPNTRELFSLAKGLKRCVIDVHYYNLFYDIFNNMTVKENIDFIYNNRSSQLNFVTTSDGPLTFVGPSSPFHPKLILLFIPGFLFLQVQRRYQIVTFRWGFQSNYLIWTEHGETTVAGQFYGEPSSTYNASRGSHIEPTQMLLCDALRTNAEDESMSGPSGSHDTTHSENPNAEASKFFRELTIANTPLYEGATESRLSISVKLLAARSNWHVPEKCIDYFAQMLVDVAPKDCGIPRNHYQARDMVSKLGLKAIKIDCCSNGCMIYYKENSELRECMFCNAPRYMDGNANASRSKEVPFKRMFYLPIIPRLQRLYASEQSASHMRWHHECRKDPNVLRHPSDGQAWKHFDDVYPDFAAESRNVRLGLCADGFTPYIQASATPYSCWPVIVTPYNLPPEMCMTKPYMFLSCLIPGPKNPKENIDVYLQPLIDDLKLLWHTGVLTYDISVKQNFTMRAMLMWTVNDFPAYGMLSGWGTQGKLACPYCMEESKSFTLKYGRKNTWFDCHRRFLPMDHMYRRSKKGFLRNRVVKEGPPYILSGHQISEFLDTFPKVTEVGFRRMQGYGVLHNWTKKSIFWDLPYWKDNLLRHNLDVMHIEKNFFDNIFNTVVNIKGKTKDDHRARMDIAELCARGDLELQDVGNGRMGKPKANYTLSPNDVKLLYKWMNKLKMPDGYASNLSRCADAVKGKRYGMKSHDCHVFMECLLPIAFRSLPDHVWKPLTEISCFFKDLCSNTLRKDDLIRLDYNIAVILCKLERIFPPGFFNSMEHLPVHLPREAILGGPVHYRWMYPYERFMGDSKRSVKNKARVEGSICTFYLQRETTYFCFHYFKNFNLLSATGMRNNPQNLHHDNHPSLSVLSRAGRPSGKEGVHWLTDAEWKSAHVHILINCTEIQPYMSSFLQSNSISDRHASSRIHDEFADWLNGNVNGPNSTCQNHHIRALAYGPASKVTSWNKFFVNGYKFHTKAWSEGKKTMNYGIQVKGVTDGGEDDFYGIVENIYEFEYPGLGQNVFLFYCQWFDPTRSTGTRVHPTYHLVDVNMNRRYSKYDPFLLPQKARQVFYVSYPEMCPSNRGWSAVISTKPRGHVEIECTEEDVIAYQADTMSLVIPIVDIESRQRLRDLDANDFEEIVTLPDASVNNDDDLEDDDDDHEDDDDDDEEDDDHDDDEEDDDDDHA